MSKNWEKKNTSSENTEFLFRMTKKLVCQKTVRKINWNFKKSVKKIKMKKIRIKKIR